MKRLCIALTLSLSLQAQEPGAFRPPHAYDVQRYEEGWSRNPFTLKTAPDTLTSESFARDLAVATFFGDAADPTIVIVNTKTHERTSLRKIAPSPKGWKLGQVNIGASRKDITVEVIRNGERAVLAFNTPYVSALAASASPSSPKGPAGQAPAANGPKVPTKLRLPGFPANQKTPAAGPPPAASAPAPASPAPDSMTAGRIIRLPVLPTVKTAAPTIHPPSS